MKNDYTKFNFRVIHTDFQTQYFIRVKKEWIEVSKEIYLICNNSYRKILRDNKRDKDKVLHFSDIDVAFFYACSKKHENPVDIIHFKSIKEQLRSILANLPKTEYYIIYQIYYVGKTEREVAAALHIPNTTLHNRKIKILRKIKMKMEQDIF